MPTRGSHGWAWRGRVRGLGPARVPSKPVDHAVIERTVEPARAGARGRLTGRTAHPVIDPTDGLACAAHLVGSPVRWIVG